MGSATKATSAATRFTSTPLLSVYQPSAEAHRRRGIEIHTDRAQLEVLHQYVDTPLLSAISVRTF